MRLLLLVAAFCLLASTAQAQLSVPAYARAEDAVMRGYWYAGAYSAPYSAGWYGGGYGYRSYQEPLYRGYGRYGVENELRLIRWQLEADASEREYWRLRRNVRR